MERFLINRNRLASIFFVVVMALCIAAPARAQGTSGQVPDPMSSAELSRLLNLYVHPTKEQGASIEGLHDSYRERFRMLRENEIERFLTKMKEMQGGMPKKEQIEEFTKGYDRVNKQIAEVDDSFFDGVATLLGEERRAAVQRARDARSRTRSSAGIMSGMMMAYPSVDLSSIVLEMGLTAEEMATIDPMLVTYEQSLTASLKDLGNTSMRMIRDMFDELEKAGFADLSQEEMLKDPEKMKEIMETMQNAMAKAGEKLMAKSKKLSEFNKKTFQSLQGQLAGDSKRKLRTQYIDKAYPELMSDPSGANALFKKALQNKKIDDTTRENIRTAYQQWQSADDAFVDQSIKEIDEARADRKLMDFSGNIDQAKRMGERMKERQEIGSKALQAVASQLSNPQMKKLFEQKHAAKDSDEAEAEESEGMDTDGEGGDSAISARASAAEMMRSGEETVIVNRGPMSEEAILAIEIQLGLDDSRKALLKTMHQDYMKNWDETVRAAQAHLDTLSGGRWTPGAAQGEMNIDEKKQEAYFSGRKDLLAKETEADAAFLSDLASVLGEKAEPVLQMAKLERVLDRTAGRNGMFGGFPFGGSQESAVNIVTVLRSAKLTPEDQAKVNEALAVQVDPLVKTQMESFIAGIDQDRELEEMSRRSAAIYGGQNGEKPDMAAMQKLGMEMMAIQSRMSELKQQRIDAVRSAWTTAVAPLGESQRESLQLVFDERAYPTIFKDSRSALPFIEMAVVLRDLTDDQRKQLQELQETSRKEHIDFCRKMLPKKAAGAPPTRTEDMGPYWQEQMAIANAREKVRFERDEHSQRAISALRRILNENQLAQINGMADYEKSAAKKKPNPFGME
ncbi:MAG: hypothetical protein K8R92_03420 [Planctomycetes bacterium]|nr:hypothetical protein [Planctomycetota bacterium]